MEFELATAKDESEIKKLLAECELVYEDITSSHLKHYFVMRDGGKIIGAVGLEIEGKYALLRSLSVATPHRSEGYGIQLTDKIEEYARSKGLETLYLLTMTAEGFFSKKGYKKVDRASAPTELQGMSEFKSLCPVSAACMVKQL